MNQQWYIANWKMYLSVQQEKDFFVEYIHELVSLAQQSKVVLCPSYIMLGLMQSFFQAHGLLVGAQDCSDELSGAHTGQVSARSLADIGVSYVIIGHSERRQRFCETEAQLSKKIAAAWQVGVTPIVCVGESKDQFERGESFDYVRGQLSVLSNALSMVQQEKQYSCFVAYEPLFAIGTGLIPPHDHIASVLSGIKEEMGSEGGASCHVTKLYGGSVSPEQSAALKRIAGVEGFLIGKSSINFAEFKKIIDT